MDEFLQFFIGKVNHMENDTMAIQNEIECRKCGERIYSGYRHDFKVCSCGSVGVDGGLAYLRRMGNRDDYIEHSTYTKTKVIEDCIESVKQSKIDNKNEFGLVLSIIRNLVFHDIIKVGTNGFLGGDE